jgi:UDP-N-acetylmuramate dehydrogenase
MEENKPLAPFTTLGVGGPARWFVAAATEAEVAEAAAWARGRNARLFVLGGGSNLLVADGGYPGLVLQVGLRGTEVAEDGGARVFRVAAGEDWDGFVERAVSEDCAGVECLAGIPGTVGGTPVQNVGAYGQEVATAITRVRALHLETMEFVEFKADECGFAYRRSRFNGVDRGKYVVTRVDYRLTPGGAPELKYGDLQRVFTGDERPNLVNVARAVRKIRQAKGMLMVEGDPDCRSAGSFFKNPVVEEDRVWRIAQGSDKELPRYPAGPDQPGKVKIPAAWLIEQAGFPKGYGAGGAGISSRHTLALINRGGARAIEILSLASEIRAAVEKKFGVSLEVEPVLLGF